MRLLKKDKILSFNFCNEAFWMFADLQKYKRIINLENVKFFIENFEPPEKHLSNWMSISWWIAANVFNPKINVMSHELHNYFDNNYEALKNIPEPVRAEYLLEIMEFEYDERIGYWKEK